MTQAKTQVENQLKIAVVTGATGGMGKEIVADLASDHKVYALGRNQETLNSLEQAHENVTALRVDMVADLLDQPASQLLHHIAEDHVDVLVHAAAVAEQSRVEDAHPSMWRGMFDLNVTAPAELTRVLLPRLRAAQGTVIYINSGAGRGAHPGNVVYAATKHALYALADALRKEEAHVGVRVSTVAPGPTDTPMLQGLREGQEYNPDHYIDPVEVARAIRTVVDAGPTTQLTDVLVRPRIELADR